MSGPNHPRGTSNGNDRGNSADRAARRRFLLDTFGDGTACPCWRCGAELTEETLTVDRIIAGVDGGRYVRGNIRPACGPCNSETGGGLHTRRPTVIAVDPGPIPGLAILRPSGHAEVAQCSATLLDPVLRGLVATCPIGEHGGPMCLLAGERFVVGNRARRSSSPGAGAQTRNMVGQIEAIATELGLALRLRSMSEVKRWASDERLERAGLLALAKGMQHARAAGRHALFAAHHDAGFPDPLARKGSR